MAVIRIFSLLNTSSHPSREEICNTIFGTIIHQNGNHFSADWGVHPQVNAPFCLTLWHHRFPPWHYLSAICS
jgi:hypothetical protein